MSGSLRDLTTWMVRQKDAARYTVRHVGLGGRSGVVMELDAAATEKRDELARQLYEAASSDCASIGGVQRYVVLAYRVEDGRSCGRFALRMRSDDELDVAGVEESEPPTSEGLLAQMMRHQEVMFRTGTQTTASVIGDLRAELRRSNERCAQLEGRHMETIELLERLKTQEHEREITKQVVTTQMAREETVLGRLMLLAPIVVNKLAGKNVLPAPEASEVALASFMESLSKEQLEGFLQTLRPEQSAVIFSMYEKARKVIDGATTSTSTATVATAVATIAATNGGGGIKEN